MMGAPAGWIAVLFAFGSGVSFYRLFRLHARRRECRLSIRGRFLESAAPGNVRVISLMDRVVDAMEYNTRSLSISRRSLPSWMVDLGGKPLEVFADQSGLEGLVSVEGFADTRMKSLLVGACLGLCGGLVFSLELGAVLLIAGGVLGWMVPKWALKQRVERRTNELEEHLPEMLDVIALAMRSGLSFDGSVRLYASHFDTLLARELTLAQRQWSSGLARRDEVLRKLAASYDSPLFERLIESIVRSLRFGSSMVASLEEDAREARSVYRSQREERIAKAPVKMMIPTGTLILPAMLIMVLGPVLLELMDGAL